MRAELLEGPCKVRGVSLPVVMDAELKRRARRTHRSISKEIQLALAEYLASGDSALRNGVRKKLEE